MKGRSRGAGERVWDRMHTREEPHEGTCVAASGSWSFATSPWRPPWPASSRPQWPEFMSSPSACWGWAGRQRAGAGTGLKPATGTKCPGRSRSGAARCPVVVAPLPNPPATHGGCSQGERGRSGCSNASLRSCRLFSYLCQLRWPGHKAQRSVGGVTPGGTASNPQSHRGSRGGPGGAEQGQGTQALPQT